MKKTIIIRHEHPEWSDMYVARLSDMFPDLDFRVAYSLDDAFALAPDAHAIVGIGPHMPPALIAAMPNLEWIQCLTTGIDNFVHMKELPTHVPVSKVSGVHGPQVSELALLMMMSLARRLPDMLEAQGQATWTRNLQPVLYGKTLCILGLGSISETLARYAATMGMTVTGVSDGRENAPNVARIYKRADLLKAAREADFLVVLVPLSENTRHIIDADIIAAMKPNAFLINVARGGCVDEAALIKALKSGDIAGAGLDVFETEPLPADDPMWTAPNVILTPHIGGFADIYGEQCLPTVIENMKIYTAAGAAALKTALVRPS